MKKRFLGFLLVFLLGCGALAEVSVTDFAGVTTRLAQPASRIVVLQAADCEILYLLGAGDAVVGRGEYCDSPADVYAVPSVQSGYQTNFEQILELDPDVVVMPYMNQRLEDSLFLRDCGIEVISTNAQTISETYQAIALLGALTGKNAEASEMIQSLQEGFQKLSPIQEAKTVYFEVSPLEWGLWTAGKNTFMNEVAEMLGLTNIFADVDGWAEVSEEQVIERNPDYIVTIGMYWGYGPTPVEEIMGRDGWQEISAVASGKILNLTNDELSRPAPRLLDGAKALYAFIHE